MSNYERAARIEDFPQSLLTKLRHLILSHQGEFETPVRPMMPEAFVLYFCDEIDSKLGAIDRIRTRQGKPGWSDYVKLLDRFLYFDDSKSADVLVHRSFGFSQRDGQVSDGHVRELARPKRW